jgi:hypothetical protein
MLDRGEGTLLIQTPHLVEDGLEPDAVFVDRPQLDPRVRERGRHLAYERAELFLKRACAAGSAWMWRGRGTCGLWRRRCR